MGCCGDRTKADRPDAGDPLVVDRLGNDEVEKLLREFGVHKGLFCFTEANMSQCFNALRADSQGSPRSPPCDQLDAKWGSCR